MRKVIIILMLIFNFSLAIDFDSSDLPQKEINPEVKAEINKKEFKQFRRKIFRKEITCGSLYEVGKEVSEKNTAFSPKPKTDVRIDGNMVFVNLYLPLTVRFLGDNGFTVKVNPNTYLADIYSPYGTQISFDLLKGRVVGSQGSPLFKLSSEELSLLSKKGVKISYNSAGLFVKWLFERNFKTYCLIAPSIQRNIPLAEKEIIRRIVFPIVKALNETDNTLILMQKNVKIKKTKLTEFSDYISKSVKAK